MLEVWRKQRNRSYVVSEAELNGGSKQPFCWSFVSLMTSAKPDDFRAITEIPLLVQPPVTYTMQEAHAPYSSLIFQCPK